MEYYGQVAADYFVINVLKHKKNGYYLEIGSNDPIFCNNSYKLETEYDWKGIMVEYDSGFLPKYQQIRPKSIHLINDARNINYLEELRKSNYPKNMDFLQIDLEVENRSTIDVLEQFNSNVFGEYKFATVIFETDIYRGDWYNTRARSREIFEANGYVRVFSDVMISLPEIGRGDCPFEDWYVHPDLVDMSMINSIKQSNSIHFKDIIYKLQQYNLKINNLKITVSEGEILDKYSILEIKANNISNTTKQEQIQRELKEYVKFDTLKNKYIIYYKLLYIINTMIWNLTNEIKEMTLLNEEYAKLSYRIFEYNQARFRLKNIINTLSDSLYKEQKSYNLKETSINITDENENIFKVLIYALLNYDRVNVFINKTLNNEFISRIRVLFPTLNYLDEKCEINLIVNFNESYNSALNNYIDTHLNNLLNPIFYNVDGTVEESIMYLSVVNENYIKTGRKGIIFYYSNNYHSSNSFNFLLKQEYIQDYVLSKDNMCGIYLNSWRKNYLLYRSSWHYIFKDEYGIEWGKHPWIKTINDEQYKNTIVLTYAPRGLSVNIKDLLSKYDINNCLLIGFSENDKTEFNNRFGINLPFKLCKTIEDMAIIINSCKLCISMMSFPLTLTQALHHNTIALLDSTLDAVHNVLGDILPNYTFVR
jgi:hypothetical protein